MKKKLLALLCVLTCVFGLTACGSEKTYTELEQSKMANCEVVAQYTLKLVSTIDAESATEITSNYNKEELATLYSESLYNAFNVTVEAKLGAFDGLMTTYNQMISDMGGLVSTGKTTSEISGDNIIVTTVMYGNECDGQIKFTFSNDIFSRFIEGDATANTTFAQKLHAAGGNMNKAGLNTLLGMGTVFIMLILISLIISSFKLIGGTGKKEKKQEVVANTAPAAVETEEDLSDDTELVAVIMAAIKAYEGNASTDGFVVRSIKKANRRI